MHFRFRLEYSKTLGSIYLFIYLFYSISSSTFIEASDLDSCKIPSRTKQYIKEEPSMFFPIACCIANPVQMGLKKVLKK